MKIRIAHIKLLTACFILALAALAVPYQAFGIISDDFNSCAVDYNVWTLIDPLGDASVSIEGAGSGDARLLLSVPAGASHDSWRVVESPHLMQDASDADFEIEVKFDSVLSEGYEGQGIIVEESYGNFIRFDFYSDGSQTMIFAASFRDGSPSIKVNQQVSLGSPMYMRVERTGNTWRQLYSGDGVNWTEAVSFNHAIAVNKVGPFALNFDTGSAPEHTAIIDYFFNTASPIVPEDGGAVGDNTLNVEVTGGGTVTVDPDQSVYLCGEEVTLTAVPDAGYEFSGWSGDVSGTANPATVTMDADRTVTATFTAIPANQYSLTVNTVGLGSVTLNPAGGIYDEGTVVQLTAVPDAGYEFSGWSGDVNGTANPATVTMDADRTITATFTALPVNQYSLTINIIGSGTVVVNPDQTAYDEGTVVQLIATPSAGYEFSGWSGDVSGTANPATVTMDADKTVTATFTAFPVNQYSLTVNTVGLGSVALSPAGGTYDEGTVVQLTAVPDAGYEFSGWSGDVSGTANPSTVTMNADRSVTATFTENSGGDLSGIMSDDFNSCAVDYNVWTLIDPLGDASVSIEGAGSGDARLLLSVPAGASHDAWVVIESPRLMQDANDTDFEVEAKFDSVLSEGYEGQGIIVEESYGNFIRFDFYSDGSQTMIFAASFSDGSPSVKINQQISLSVPMYMRVERTGNTWKQLYSGDGVNWTEAVSFSHAIAVNKVGPFALNFDSGGNAPEHTAIIDYFFNTASLIVPEDGGAVGDNTLNVEVIGGGTVTVDPDQSVYLCGEEVTLTAVPDAGYEFSGWSGDVSGTANPAMVTMNADRAVTATFISGSAPPVISNVQVFADQTSATITWSTNKPSTSLVDYGETLSYELGSVEDVNYVTSHSINLSNLQPGTTYNYIITSVDSGGHSASTGNMMFTTTPASSPVIDVWYGNHQTFGHIGVPQRWVNILGNVSDSDGIASLTYSLNGGPEYSLSLGPDKRRLLEAGDFNVEIAVTDLIDGNNQTIITAVDNLGNQSVEIVTVEFYSGNVWPDTYSIDWNSVADIQDVAQIVDGQWSLVNDGVRTDVLGYDRIIAIGDMLWENYEVIVPITAHQIGSSSSESGVPGIGVLMRWDGHHNWYGEQPNIGWVPLGAIGWYMWDGAGQLGILGNYDYLALDNSGFVMQLDTRYIFKLRVETVQAGLYLHSLKVWEDGQPEPSGWSLTAYVGTESLQYGSLLLLAHEVDATFGNVEVYPVSAP